MKRTAFFLTFLVFNGCAGTLFDRDTQYEETWIPRVQVVKIADEHCVAVAERQEQSTCRARHDKLRIIVVPTGRTVGNLYFVQDTLILQHPDQTINDACLNIRYSYLEDKPIPGRRFKHECGFCEWMFRLPPDLAAKVLKANQRIPFYFTLNRGKKKINPTPDMFDEGWYRRPERLIVVGKLGEKIQISPYDSWDGLAFVRR